jgi:hypothetical protein
MPISDLPMYMTATLSHIHYGFGELSLVIHQAEINDGEVRKSKLNISLVLFESVLVRLLHDYPFIPLFFDPFYLFEHLIALSRLWTNVELS